MTFTKKESPWKQLNSFADLDWNNVGELVRYVLDNELQDEFNTLTEHTFSNGQCSEDEFRDWCTSGDALNTLQDNTPSNNKVWALATYIEHDGQSEAEALLLRVFKHKEDAINEATKRCLQEAKVYGYETLDTEQYNTFTKTMNYTKANWIKITDDITFVAKLQNVEVR